MQALFPNTRQLTNMAAINAAVDSPDLEKVGFKILTFK